MRWERLWRHQFVGNNQKLRFGHVKFEMHSRYPNVDVDQAGEAWTGDKNLQL